MATAETANKAFHIKQQPWSRLTMSTTRWLLMNSDTPSLTMTRIAWCCPDDDVQPASR
jgi:hypothetical protein